MNYIRFGRTGVSVPTISLGTWGHGGARESEGEPVGWSGHDDALAKAALVEAWKRGITHWDTADAYGDGHAELLIGEALREVPRSDLFIATKFGWVKGPSRRWYDPAFMREQCERSLRSMGIETIDLYYLHHCHFGQNDEALDGAVEMARRFRDEGKVRFIGLSDWDASRIVRFLDAVDPDVVQPYRNLVDDDYESSGLAAAVAARDLGVAFFSPLKHGLLLGKYDAPQTFPPGDFRSGVDDFSDAEVLTRYRAAAEAVRKRFATHEQPVLHAVIGALLTGNPTATVLLGQRNPRQVAAAAAVGEALTPADAAWVRSQYRAPVTST